MKIFTHNNFPAQFRHIYRELKGNSYLDIKFLAIGQSGVMISIKKILLDIIWEGSKKENYAIHT